MPKKRRKPARKNNLHILILIPVIVVVGLVSLISIISIKDSVSRAPQSVLGELEEARNLTPCSGGGLTTAVFKDFQMQYANEDFLRVVNSKDLLKNVSQLKDLTCLQYLDATDQTVKGDIASLKNLKNLEVFSLYSNPEVSGDICSLAGATKLRSLKFAFDPKITGDISCLKNLKKLETFAMTHTNIKGDISVFANMPNLKAIYISGTYVKGNICSLSKLTNLEELGIADEYPGNPDITGNLGCLDNLKKLKRVAIYNTKTTNCEQFTKSHQGMEKTVTASGHQGGGGCSKESMKTVVDYAQKYEQKIGKEVQTEVRGQPNYNKGFGGSESFQGGKDDRNFFQKLIGAIMGIFGRRPEGPENSPQQQINSRGDGRMPEGAVGPGGCKSQTDCDAFCDKQENREECSKFAPPDQQGQ